MSRARASFGIFSEQVDIGLREVYKVTREKWECASAAGALGRYCWRCPSRSHTDALGESESPNHKTNTKSQFVTLLNLAFLQDNWFLIPFGNLHEMTLSLGILSFFH